MPQWMPIPANSVLVAGTPLIQEFRVVTATTMYPKRIVMRDTYDGGIKVAGALEDAPIGVLMEEPGELEATIYDAGDMARVIVGGPCVVKVDYTSNGKTNVVFGGRLVCAASGKVAPPTAGAIGSQGAMVGRAWSTPSGVADQELLMLLEIVPDIAAAT
jgi:hypothetical protein